MIVIDTHVIIWDALRPGMVSEKARDAIRAANKGDGILFSEISLFEIGLLMREGALSVSVSYREFIDLVLNSNQYVLSRITPEVADTASRLPGMNGIDLVDRIICATAIHHGAALITADRHLIGSEYVRTIW